jgi:hypothetical protein
MMRKLKVTQRVSALIDQFVAWGNRHYYRERESRALKSQKKQVDDDTNDFNDDYSLYDAFSKAEGKLSGGSGKTGKQTSINGLYTGANPIIDDEGGYGGYGGKRGK